ncbi:hypothetical protein H0H93_016078 [Arthromyces matolae]|nr:hypothetical protein H0H93_016078 [Arthromyces matolae]
MLAVKTLLRNTLSLSLRCRGTAPILWSPFRHITSYSQPNTDSQTWDTLIDDSPPRVKQAFEIPTDESADEKWKRISQESLFALKALNFPATTYAGRSVQVKNGNVAKSYDQLQTILQRNKVQAQLRRTERHEKKGVKRRRLSSERWRRRFAHECVGNRCAKKYSWWQKFATVEREELSDGPQPPLIYLFVYVYWSGTSKV